MTTSRNLMKSSPDRRKVSVRRHLVAAALALAVVATTVGVPHLSDADTSSGPPVSQCSDFGCEK